MNLFFLKNIKQIFMIIPLFFILGCQHKKIASEKILIKKMTPVEENLFMRLESSKCEKDVVSEILDPINKVNFNSISKDHELTYLHIATIYCSNDLFSQILLKTKETDLASVFSKTPLTLALEQNDIFKSEQLLKQGANPNHLEFIGNPIFFIPLKNKNKLLLNLLFTYRVNTFQLGFMESSWREVFKNHEFQSLIDKYERNIVNNKK